MILTVKNYKYDESYKRAKLAESLARIIDSTVDFALYMPNEGDDTFWRVDYTGNNWTLVFNKEDDFKTFRLEYRYCRGNPEVEKALYGWLKIKMPGLELVEE